MQLNEPSWISTEPRNHLVFDTLQSFLDSATAESANVQQLADSTVIRLRCVGTQNPSINQYRLESRALFAILFTIVKQLDAAAEQHDHLVKLVLSIRSEPLPASVTQDIDPSVMDRDMNQDLNPLIYIWTDCEMDAPMYPPLEDRPDYDFAGLERPPWRQAPGRYLTGAEWANLNAFMARLHTAAPDLRRVEVRGLYAMIEALEMRLTPTQLEDELPAAAVWIIYAGKALKHNDFPFAYYNDDGGSRRLPWSKGELWNGPHAFNQARWDFWMQRFKDIAEKNDVSDTMKLAALQAFEAGSS